MPTAEPESAGAADAIRLDRFLWFARLTKTRELARALAEQGHIRLAGRRIERAHAPVRIGDVLSLAVHGRVRVLRVKALPTRRGPAAEAARLYIDLAAGDPRDHAQLTGAAAGD